jgi:hypothetical protein
MKALRLLQEVEYSHKSSSSLYSTSSSFSTLSKYGSQIPNTSIKNFPILPISRVNFLSGIMETTY